MSGLGPILGSVAVAAIGLFGTWLVQRNQKRANKTSDTQTIIDQLQEERAADRENFANAARKFEDRQQRLENRLENAEALFRISSDYVLALRYHIAEGHPPPPPPYPAEMTRGLGGDR